MRNKNQKIAHVSLIILLLSLTFLAQSELHNQLNPICQNRTFTTSQTKCSITFLQCPNELTNKFLSCTINHCQRYLGTQNCQRSLDFSLTEKSCYNQCCKSNTFNQAQCESANAKLKQLHQSQDNFMILGLVIMSVGLVGFTLIFFVVVLKCNKNQENQKNLNDTQSLINWMDVKYSDEKCDVCSTYGAVILTPCNHWYHESCYIKQTKNDEIKCIKCPEKMFSYVRIVCGDCREKQFKVRVTKGSILKEIIAEGMIQHASKCQKFSKDLCTDIRLTSTGSSSD